MSDRSIGLFKTAAIITIITLVSKIFGFLREVIIAFYFGTSSEVDMYLMAVNIPTIILGFITCIGTAYVPVYNEITVKEGKKKSLGFTTHLIILMSIICGIIILVCSVNAEHVTRLVAPGFTPEMISITSNYLRISMWNLIVITVMNIFICYLNCNNRFSQASLCMLLHSSVQIIFTFLAHIIGPIFLTVGYVISNVFYLIAVVIVSIKNDYRFNNFYYDNKYARMLLKLLIPITVSSLITQINGYVDKYFASSLAEGSISALHYSNTIRTFVVMMLNTGLITVFFPTMSRLVSKGKIDVVRRTLLSAIRYVILVFLPMTILLIMFAAPITRLLFGRGEFNSLSVDMTSIAIQMYAIGITAVALRDIFFNFFYSIKDSIFTLIVSIVGIIINIGLNILLVNKLGIVGLALATSLAAIFIVPVFVLRLRKHMIGEEKIGEEKNSGFVKYIFKCLISNALPFFAILLVNYNIISNITVIIAMIEGCIYLIIYFLILKLFKIEEITFVIDTIKRFTNKVKSKKCEE